MVPKIGCVTLGKEKCKCETKPWVGEGQLLPISVTVRGIRH